MNNKVSSKKFRENRYRKAEGQPRATTARWPVVFLKFFSVATAIAVMSLVFIFGYDWITQWEYFSAEKIEVSGLKRLDREQALRAAKISEGINILSVNLAAARKRMLALPWVAGAEIRREFPDIFRIKIYEHTPVAVIELGRSFLVNAEGQIFKETDREQFRNLPVISGAKYQHWKDDVNGKTRMSESVMFVLNRGMKDHAVLPYESIVEIQADPELGLTVITGQYPARKIHLGFGEYESKYTRLSKLFSYLERRGVAGFEEIDLRYRDRIVAKPAKDQANLTRRQKEA
ncbi:MAG: FtsQ-type POTRA domain-containing protein [Desulfobacteraceae bacterium]|nr:FtsQ-type POTRA domain-containing protein [Desulfobacteraceae bacterium]